MGTMAEAFEQEKKRQASAENRRFTEGALSSVTEGLLFGFRDELESGVQALYNAAVQGTPITESYRERLSELESQRKQFEKQNPIFAPLSEMAGALPAGIAASGRALATQALNRLSPAARSGRIAAVGGAEGAVYGAGKAQPDERVEGASTGAMIGAPLAVAGAGAVNLLGDLLSRGVSTVTRKATDAPADQASRVLQDALRQEGLTPQQAAARVAQLNQTAANTGAMIGAPIESANLGQATISDIGPAFQTTARAAMDLGDQAKIAGRSLVNKRQAGQRKRIKELLTKTFGADGAKYFENYEAAIAARQRASTPLYREAHDFAIDLNAPGSYQQTVTGFDDPITIQQTLQEFIDDDLIKPLYKTAQRKAKSEMEPGDVNMRALDQLKRSLDDKISAAKRKGEKYDALFYTRKKNGLKSLLIQQNPVYGEALETFSSHSAITNSMEDGLTFLKVDPDVLKVTTQNLPSAELDAFRTGAMKALQDVIEKGRDNVDVVKQLIGSESMRKRLAAIIPEDNVEGFLRTLRSEADFASTRSALTSGSDTAQRGQAMNNLRDSLDPSIFLSLVDPVSIIPTVARVLSKGKPTPELIEELTNNLFRRGMSQNEIIKVFEAPINRTQLGQTASRIAPIVNSVFTQQNVRAGIVPTTMAIQE